MISRLVTEIIVDQLKVIKIAHQHGKLRSPRPDLLVYVTGRIIVRRLVLDARQ